MKQGRYREALTAFNFLRSGPAGPLIAARDLFYAHSQLDVEARLIEDRRRRGGGGGGDEVIELPERLARGPDADPEIPQVDTYLYQIRRSSYWQRFGQLFSEPRCRRASLAAATVMLTQQMTGVNTLGR
jgi:hypothetical protein